MATIVKRGGKTEIEVQRGSDAERARADGAPVVSIWSRVRKRVGVRLDSWLNLLTGIGVPGLDASSATDFRASVILPDAFLEQLYDGDDIAARIIDAVPEEALAEGYEVVIEPDLSEESEDTEAEATVAEAKQMGADVRQFLEDELGTTEKLIEAWAWGRLYGAGALYMIVDDGTDTDQAEELNLDRVTRVEALTVLDKQDLDPASVYDDPTHPKFGEVETYRVNQFSTLGLVQEQLVNVQIHESRLILFEGARTTNRRKQTNEGFSLSVLQRVFDVLKMFNISWAALSNMLQAASQGVFSIHGLIEMIAGGQSDVMQRRMSLVDLQRSVARSILIDAEEEKFEQIETNVTGVPDALRVFMLRIAAAAKMPLTVLMGMSPAGMNATGDSDLRIWAKRVTVEQNRVLRPRMMRLIDVVMHSSDGPTSGQVPERWSVQFPPLIQMTEREEAEIRKLTAEADAIYIDRQVLIPEEVAISRFTPDGFSPETVIDLTDRAKMLEGDPPPDPDDPPDPTLPPQPDPGPKPEGAPTDPEAVDPGTALNGAQVSSMLAIIDKVVLGEYSKTTAARVMSASFPMSEAEAALILADVEEADDDDGGPGGGSPPVPPTGTPPPGPPSPPEPPEPPEPPQPTGPPEPPEPDDEREDAWIADAHIHYDEDGVHARLSRKQGLKLLLVRLDRIEERGGQFCVLPAEGGEPIACHDDRDDAVRQLAAIEAAKAARGDQAHVHSLPGGSVTGPGEGNPHTHSIPGGGRTGSANAGAGHTHSLPGGGRTGGPREA